MIDNIKISDFEWTKVASTTFHEIKQKMMDAPVLRLFDIYKPFEVAYNASRIRIGGVLSQEGHPIAYFSENLNDMKLQYSTYDKEFYVVL